MTDTFLNWTAVYLGLHSLVLWATQHELVRFPVKVVVKTVLVSRFANMY